MRSRLETGGLSAQLHAIAAAPSLHAKPELERHLGQRGITDRVPVRIDDQRNGLYFVVSTLGLAISGHRDACEGKVTHSSVAALRAGQGKPVDSGFLRIILVQVHPGFSIEENDESRKPYLLLLLSCFALHLMLEITIRTYSVTGPCLTSDDFQAVGHVTFFCQQVFQFNR